MGTNFYWHNEERPACECCHRPFVTETIHIGKSSVGWCFSLHVTDEIKSLDDWKEIWASKSGFIKNEYDEIISVEEMLNIITNRKGINNFSKEFSNNYYNSWSHFHRTNTSEPGPNGLLRHVVNEHCIGHGDGTWDLIYSSFS